MNDDNGIEPENNLIEQYDDNPALLQSLMSDPDLLLSYGYRLTPKGILALTLMQELGFAPSKAERLAQKLEDAVFLSGHIWLHESEIQLAGDTNEPPSGR